jgi:tripartite ATP-independent transporter DctM subunit
MSTLGLLLIAGVAVGVITTGLPAYLVLLMAATLGAVAGLATGHFTAAVLGSLPSRLIGLLESDILQALPLYLLMGAILNRLGIAEAIFRTGTSMLPRTPAAPLVSGFLLGGLLGPMNGSVGASVLALSRTLGPRLVEAGVPPARREAIVAVAGTIGVVVPPSLVLILLGDAMLTAHTIAINATGRTDRIINTQDLLRGALAPAGLFLFGCIIVSWLVGRRTDAAAAPRLAAATWRDVAVAGLAVGFLVLLLGGVALGRFFAVEAAALGAFVMFVAALASGRLRDDALPRVLTETMEQTGALFAPLLAATTFTLVLRLLGTDKLINDWVAALPGGMILAVIVILGAIGLAAFALDAFEIIFVAVPILVPPLLMRAPDAVWVGVLVLLVLQMSFLLPPFGYALILARSTLKEQTRLGDVMRALAPFLALQIAVLLLVVCVPALVHLADPPKPAIVVPAVLSKEELDKRTRSIQFPAPVFGLPGPPPNFGPPKP